MGTHKKSGQPMGTLANARLRHLRSSTHQAFDPRWENSSTKQTRHQNRCLAYTWLALKLKIPSSQCHIGLFDEAMCLRAIEVCNDEH